MKKILFLMAILSICLKTYSQQTGIFYKDEKVGYSRIIGNNVGNIVGASLTFGISSAKSNKVIEGDMAELEIEEAKPEFSIIFGEDKQTGYIFSNSKNLDEIVLVKLHVKKGSRNLRSGKYGLSGVKTGVDEKDIIPIAIDKVDDNTYNIHPKKKLEKGEYCFFYVGKPQNEENPFNGVFDFSIK
ncbi:hypothetical protein [Bacteroides sp. 51]|uniref:hypothetical protein n=1 Tax=Bacteroides sp. 51 TaxID=2302938 RepID=UPI0013D21D4D|nr:hypothetical protein [Bacteroides sp. 51]NDV83623.1 hypothetical protein [Bacteroides sp. 51]